MQVCDVLARNLLESKSEHVAFKRLPAKHPGVPFLSGGPTHPNGSEEQSEYLRPPQLASLSRMPESTLEHTVISPDAAPAEPEHTVILLDAAPAEPEHTVIYDARADAPAEPEHSGSGGADAAPAEPEHTVILPCVCSPSTELESDTE